VPRTECLGKVSGSALEFANLTRNSLTLLFLCDLAVTTYWTSLVCSPSISKAHAQGELLYRYDKGFQTEWRGGDVLSPSLLFLRQPACIAELT
jgi:hypothetical protein